MSENQSKMKQTFSDSKELGDSKKSGDSKELNDLTGSEIQKNSRNLKEKTLYALLALHVIGKYYGIQNQNLRKIELQEGVLTDRKIASEVYKPFIDDLFKYMKQLEIFPSTTSEGDNTRFGNFHFLIANIVERVITRLLNQPNNQPQPNLIQGLYNAAAFYITGYGNAGAKNYFAFLKTVEALNLSDSKLKEIPLPFPIHFVDSRTNYPEYGVINLNMRNFGRGKVNGTPATMAVDVFVEQFDFGADLVREIHAKFPNTLTTYVPLTESEDYLSEYKKYQEFFAINFPKACAIFQKEFEKELEKTPLPLREYAIMSETIGNKTRWYFLGNGVTENQSFSYLVDLDKGLNALRARYYQERQTANNPAVLYNIQRYFEFIFKKLKPEDKAKLLRDNNITYLEKMILTKQGKVGILYDNKEDHDKIKENGAQKIMLTLTFLYDHEMRRTQGILPTENASMPSERFDYGGARN